MGADLYDRGYAASDQRYRDRRSRNALADAGDALKAGDYGMAANALFDGGDLESGLAVQNAQRSRQTADREAMRTAALAVMTGLRHMPEASRANYLREIAGRLSVYGITPEQIASVTPEDLTDRGLDGHIAFLGGDAPTARIMQGYRGSIDSVDPYTGEISMVRGPQQQEAPTGYRWKPDGTLEVIPGYVTGQDQIADARRAPPRARASAGGRRSGSANRPAAAPARKPWENY